jgi:hypothetical protein
MDYGVQFGPHRVTIPTRHGYRVVTWEHTVWLYEFLGYAR